MKRFYILLVIFVCQWITAQKQQSVGFIENKGQIVDQKGKQNEQVNYLLNTPGLNVQLRKNGFSYDVYETKKKALTSKEPKRSSNLLSKEDNLQNQEYKLEYRYHRIDIDFVNANSDVKLVAEGKSTDYDNYYNVISKPNGVLDVHKFQKVTYIDIYPNIDVIFFVPDDKSKPVEYNFIVKPNGNINDIQLKFAGAKTELVDNKIKMNVRFGEMEETLPMSWTENDKKTIAISYKKIIKNVYGFTSDDNIEGKKVIIDPTPNRLWGTYYDGELDDLSTDICNDPSNNVIISGHTHSTTNMATIGSYNPFPYAYYTGNGFIAKFDTNGVRQWGIYYSTVPTVVKADGNGNIYFTGSVFQNEAPNVATPGSHQPIPAYYDDAFLVKLSPSGVRDWGTYYGGMLMDQGRDICFDSSNFVYLVGVTASPDNIATPGAHQVTYGPGIFYDGFIVKFTPLGARVWGTYYGGSNWDEIYSANISADSYLYVTGRAISPNGIATPGSFQPTMTGSDSGMIAKFDLNGQRIWGSYFGGNQVSSLNVSRINGNYLYFTGIISPNTHFTTANTAGTFNPNSIDVPMQFARSSYIAKFDLTTQTLVWGTYFGEIIQDLEVSTNGKVFIEGVTYLTTGIATPGAFRTSPQYSDAYVIKLNENGQREWGTYYGGNFFEGSNGAADVNNKMSLDPMNNIYLIGNTSSTAGLSTPGSHQPNHTVYPAGGIYNIYVAKLQDCLSSPVVNGNSNICVGDTINLTASGGTNYSWTGPNSFATAQQNPIILNAATSQSGTYYCTITGTGGCDGTVSTNVVVGDTIKPVPDNATLPTINGDCNTIVSSIPTATDNCSGSITGTTIDPLTHSLPGNYTIHWNYTDANGNTETQNQTLIINPVTLPTTVATQTFCIQQSATINDITIAGLNIKWYDAASSGNLLNGTTLLQNGITYYASQTINSCESLRVPVLINIQNTATPTGFNPQTFCAAQNATLNTIAITGTTINWYSSVSSTIILPFTTLLTDGNNYYATQTLYGCESVGRLPVTITLITTLNAANYTTTICDLGNDDSESIDLSQYNTNLVGIIGNTFTYYNSFNGAENQIASEEFNTNHSIVLGLNTIYVRIDSVNGCHQIVQLQLTLMKVPIVDIADEVILCENNRITVTAGSFNSYTWSTGATTNSIVVTQPGNYSVTVTQNHGSVSCSSTKNFTVVLSNAPIITSIDTVDWTDAENSITINLSSTSIGDYEYSIDGVTFQNSNTFNGLPNGAYTVTVRDKNKCGIATQEIFLLNYPKFFTPNNDGHNDGWSIKYSQFEPHFEVRIFDRYGKLLAILPNNKAWDGKYDGKPLLADDYWFNIIRNDGRIHKGHFALLR